MSNIKEFRLTADVPFDWLTGLPADETAAFASLLLHPSMGCQHRYESLGFVPNAYGGATAMYRLSIEGTEALPWPFLERLATNLAQAGTLHIAEARDVQWENEIGAWTHVVDPALLSGEAER